ncbi:MAG: hypothetical protein RLZZ200_1790 [Pseudomonadota bacterium]|jgi:peptidyl-prolyl cis-trans isomerase SurA
MTRTTFALLGMLLVAQIAPAAEPAARADLSSKGQLLDRVAAIVNDDVVTFSELDDQIAVITQRLQETRTPLPAPDVLRKQVLDRLVVQEVQLQRARKLGLKVGDEQLNAALSDVAQRNNIKLADLPRALSEQGLDYASYRENMRKEIALSALRQRDVIAKINVTPRELEQFIERKKKLPSETMEYNVSHILIAVQQDATQAQVDEAAKRAQDVFDRARGTEDFGRLAVAYSGSQTALEGGALGWRKGPELPTFLAEEIVKLKAGGISPPIRTPSGFHLIKLNQTRSIEGDMVVEQSHARHILIRPNELQDDATVKQRLTDIRTKVLNGEDFAAFASSLSADPGSSVNGGDLGWNGPGTFVPEFETTLARLKDNEISEPIRSQFGWHLIQLLGRRKFDMTEEAARQRAFAQLRESKADEETELWLRRLRDEAFVETLI